LLHGKEALLQPFRGSPVRALAMARGAARLCGQLLAPHSSDLAAKQNLAPQAPQGANPMTTYFQQVEFVYLKFLGRRLSSLDWAYLEVFEDLGMPARLITATIERVCAIPRTNSGTIRSFRYFVPAILEAWDQSFGDIYWSEWTAEQRARFHAGKTPRMRILELDEVSHA
jgi:hypothetical protein